MITLNSLRHFTIVRYRSEKTKCDPPAAAGSPNWLSDRYFPCFFPELTQLIQPLSGEYAGFREIFERIPFPIGYGVETSMNMDIYEKWGLDVMAQVDLDRRIHRNQDTKALGRMAFTILRTFINRKVRLGLIDLRDELFEEMIQYNLVNNKYQPDIFKIEGHERPPIIEIPEYREKFKIDQEHIQKLQEA